MGNAASSLVSSSTREQLWAGRGESLGLAPSVIGARVEERYTMPPPLARAALVRPGRSLAGLSYRLMQQHRQSETDPATIGCCEISQHEEPEPLLIAAFCPIDGLRSSSPLATMAPKPPGSGAKNRCDPNEASGFVKISATLKAETPDLLRKGGVGTAGNHEEGEHPRSPQAFSGRPAATTGRVPEVSNETAKPQSGVAGSQRPNQSSACQSREQRHTGPRTPLRKLKGRPRANYNKKEHSKCIKVEYDSC
jgi:hypothetical protein